MQDLFHMFQDQEHHLVEVREMVNQFESVVEVLFLMYHKWQDLDLH
jgi:hypothetical protein